MGLRQFDYNLLKLLDILLQERSVSRAAERLNVSQPAVSAALSRLRQQFGDELFIRSASGIIATEYAQSLEQPIQRVLALIETDILQARNFDPMTTPRDFRIATSDLGEAMLLPRLVELVERDAPQCVLSSISLPPRMLLEAMGRGDIDLAIGYFPDLGSNGIHESPLGATSLVCLARKDHPQIDDTLDLETFQTAPHAVAGHESRAIDVYEELIARQGIKRNIRVRLANMMSLPQVIASTDLITVAPAMLARFQPGMKQVAIPFELPPLEIKMFWHHRSHKDPANVWLRNCVTSIEA